MKRVLRFSRYRLVMIAVSSAVLLAGVVLLATRGINLGIDFRGGLTQQIQFAPVAMRLTATGADKIEASSYSGEREILGGDAIGFTVINGAESQSFRFAFSEYATLRDLAAACETVPGLIVTLVADAGLATRRLVPVDTPVDITKLPLALNYVLAASDKPSVNTADVRAALTDLGQFEVQTLGRPEDQQFILKVAVPQGDDLDFRQTIEGTILDLLARSFARDEIIIQKTDYVGRTLSGELTSQTISVIAVALVFMLVYLTFRFGFESALAAVLCVMHDSAVMVTVALLLGLEFSTLVIAAILTIIGYSVNDTIVIFDRVRENRNVMRDSDEKTVFDTSISQTLGRTIVTSLVTLLAVVAMYVFTSGSLKDFSLMLIVGILVGTYSTIYIASPIVMLWHSVARRSVRRRDAQKYGAPVAKPEPVERPADQAAASIGGGEAEKPGPPAPGGSATGTVIRQQPSRKKKRR